MKRFLGLQNRTNGNNEKEQIDRNKERKGNETNEKESACESLQLSLKAVQRGIHQETSTYFCHEIHIKFNGEIC